MTVFIKLIVAINIHHYHCSQADLLLIIVPHGESHNKQPRVLWVLSQQAHISSTLLKILAVPNVVFCRNAIDTSTPILSIYLLTFIVTHQLSSSSFAFSQHQMQPDLGWLCYQVVIFFIIRIVHLRFWHHLELHQMF